jgi:hypothetical protein
MELASVLLSSSLPLHENVNSAAEISNVNAVVFIERSVIVEIFNVNSFLFLETIAKYSS